MDSQINVFFLWVNHDTHVASFHPVAGYEQLRFPTREKYQAKVRILVQSGFRFQ